MPTLVRRVLVLVAALVAYRVAAAIPLPFLLGDAPKALVALGSEADASLLGLFRGGPLTAGSIVALGLTPLVTASLLVQMASQVIPKLKMREHPDRERAVARLTRLLCVPLALLQGVQLLLTLSKVDYGREPLFRMHPVEVAAALTVLTAGTLLLSYLAGLVSRHGLGNGVAFLLMASTVASDASGLRQLWNFRGASTLWFAVPLTIGVAVAVFGVSARYELPIVTARVEETLPRPAALPFRFTGPGAASLIVASSMVGLTHTLLALAVPPLRGPLASSWGSTALLGVLVFVATYTFIRTMTPVEELHDEMVKRGRFLPGVAPGEPSAKVLRDLQRRMSLTAALLLLPFVVMAPAMMSLTGLPLAPLTGTGVLLAVGYFADVLAQVRRMRRIAALPARHGLLPAV